MGNSPFSDEITAELSEMATELGCQIAHIELRGGQLRVILDHPEAVTLEHCAAMSKQLSAVLDRDDFGDRSYVLEVSSPGLDRQLHRPADYARFAGRKIRVTFRDAETRAKETLVATLASIEPAPDAASATAGVGSQETKSVITVVDDQGAGRKIALDDIQIARLEIAL